MSILKHTSRITAVAFSPDGRTVLTGTFDGAVQLWETATGRAIESPIRHPGEVLVLDFSPDGGTVLTGGSDGTVRLWDIATRKPIGPPLRHQAPIQVAVFRDDGKLITESADRDIRLWKVPTPVECEVEILERWLRMSTGIELDPAGAIRESVIDPKQAPWRSLEQRSMATDPRGESRQDQAGTIGPPKAGDTSRR